MTRVMAVVVLGMLACLRPAAGAAAPFADLSFEEALSQAKAENKTVFIDFYTQWCMPCKKLDATTWKDSQVQRFLGRHAVSLKVDCEERTAGAPLARRFRVRAFPTMVYVNAQGQEVGRIMGYKSAEQFIQASAQILGVAAPKIDVDASEAEAARNAGAHRRLALAKTYAEQGRHAEALADYMWCLEHGGEEPNFGALRTGALMFDLGRLAAVYPETNAAMRGFRDRLRDDLVAGRETSWSESVIVVRVSEVLGDVDDAGLLPMYDAGVEAKAPAAVLARLRRSMVGPLVEAGRYDDLGRDPKRDILGQLRRQPAVEMQVARRVAGANPGEIEAVKLASRRDLLDRASHYYQMYLATGDQAGAGEIADAIRKLDDGWFTSFVLARAGVRAGKATDAHVRMAEVGFEGAAAATAARAGAVLVGAYRAVGRDADAERAAAEAAKRASSDAERRLIRERLQG